MPTLRWVASWFPTYLTSLFCQVEKRFHNGWLNRRPFYLEMGTSPLSPGTLGSSWTLYFNMKVDNLVSPSGIMQCGSIQFFFLQFIAHQRRPTLWESQFLITCSCPLVGCVVYNNNRISTLIHKFRACIVEESKW